MLQQLHDYEQLTLQATNGDLGQVEDFLFDDEHWTIRYLVATTGSLFGRKVAISPISIVEPAWAESRLRVGLTREQIRNSPDLLSRLPIPRSAERVYASYYGYPAYWGGSSLWAWAGYPGALAKPAADESMSVEETVDISASRLRSVSDLRGSHLRAKDDGIGQVDDVIFNDESWSLRYLLVDTSNWPGGAHVLVPTTRVASVNWTGCRVNVDLFKEQIERAPRYDPDTLLGPAAERALAMHYDSPSPRRAHRASGTAR